MNHMEIQGDHDKEDHDEDDIGQTGGSPSQKRSNNDVQWSKENKEKFGMHDIQLKENLRK